MCVFVSQSGETADTLKVRGLFAAWSPLISQLANHAPHALAIILAYFPRNHRKEQSHGCWTAAHQQHASAGLVLIHCFLIAVFISELTVPRGLCLMWRRRWSMRASAVRCALASRTRWAVPLRAVRTAASTSMPAARLASRRQKPTPLRHTPRSISSVPASPAHACSRVATFALGQAGSCTVISVPPNSGQMCTWDVPHAFADWSCLRVLSCTPRAEAAHVDYHSINQHGLCHM